jgi:hypothetical protein
MNVLITGGTGFIGKALCTDLAMKNYTLWILTRNPDRARQLIPFKNIRYIQNFNEITNDIIFDSVINLSGEPIAKRWTPEYKKILFESRIGVTQRLIECLSRLSQPPRVLISGSAIGFYGAQKDHELSETSAYHTGFTHDLCQAWENAALEATSLGTRVCCLRTGVVLGTRGGMLKQIRLPYLMGLGGPIGDGNQWMSWVHINDLIKIIVFCINNEQMQGPVNATAPNPVRNKMFAKLYGKVLYRPALVPMPALFLHLLFGEMADELLLRGQKVIPSKLRNAGFQFQYPELEMALMAIAR